VFEAGFIHGGQTKEHIYIIKSLGVSDLIVAINKMDLIKWNQTRYDEIIGMLSPFLQKLGFEEKNIRYIPVAAFSGLNIFSRVNDVNWYKGPCLLELIGKIYYKDTLPVPERETQKPFRMVITNIFTASSGKIKGEGISGKIESGFLHEKDKLIIAPLGIPVKIKEICENSEKAIIGKTGEIIDCGLQFEEEYDLQKIR